MIRLTENKIAVEPIWDSDYSPSGLIIIPDEAKERCDQGIVKYVGPKVKDLKIGDYVLFSGYTGTTVRLEGEGIFIIMREDFVTAIVEEPATDIPGLYFRDKNGEYWTATYEMAMRLMAKRLQEIQPLKKVKELMHER
jgi:co-chaperonin GroES (HSP10)